MDFDYLSDNKRNFLYNEVWADPVTTVAKRYNLSDNELRKHCQKLRIPLPPSGYWAKVRAGQNPPKTPLPRAAGELRRYVHNYAIKYRLDLNELTDEDLLSKEEYTFSMNKQSNYEALVYEDEKDNPIENQLQKIMY